MTGPARPSRPGSTARTPACQTARLEAHLAGCAACRDWQQRAHVMTRRARLGGPFLDRDLTGQVLAAIPPAPARRRLRLAVRAALLAVALGQLAITVPLLILGHDHDAGTHAAHELGSFDLALAIAFAVGAIRPALSAGLAWPCGIAAGGLVGHRDRGPDRRADDRRRRGAAPDRRRRRGAAALAGPHVRHPSRGRRRLRRDRLAAGGPGSPAAGAVSRLDGPSAVSRRRRRPPHHTRAAASPPRRRPPDGNSVPRPHAAAAAEARRRRQGSGRVTTVNAGGRACRNQRSPAWRHSRRRRGREIELSVAGMTCAACAARVEKKLGKLDGVRAAVNYATGIALVTAPASMPVARPHRGGHAGRLYRDRAR